MKHPMPFRHAEQLAETIRWRLAPSCLRIECAGSVRRRRPTVGDIEMVAIPLTVNDLFGQPFSLNTDHALNHVDWPAFGKLVMDGPKEKRIELNEGIMLELYIVTPPAQWGVIFLLRTGPKAYSKRMVTKRRYRGLMPSNLHFKHGAIWENGRMLLTPEEQDIYAVYDMAWVEPEKREA